MRLIETQPMLRLHGTHDHYEGVVTVDLKTTSVVHGSDLITLIVHGSSSAERISMADVVYHMYNVHMKNLVFQWDKRKATANLKKHGVSFEEAKTAFFDESALQFFDPDHSEDEDRFLLLGTSYALNTLVVCHCFREEETVIRIITARKADAEEEREYWRQKI